MNTDLCGSIFIDGEICSPTIGKDAVYSAAQVRIYG